MFQAFDRMLRRTGLKMRLILSGHREGWEQLRGEFPGLPVTHLGYVREELVKALMARAVALPFFSVPRRALEFSLLEAFA